jgi:hypothetical protein
MAPGLSRRVDRPMAPDKAAEIVTKIEMPALPDRQTLEALQLEIRQLARESGLSIKDFRVESATGREPGSSS